MSNVDPAAQSVANWVALYPKGQQAITNNQAFLAVTAPSQAQAVAQVEALTRQIDAVIRVLLGMLDTTDGT